MLAEAVCDAIPLTICVGHSGVMKKPKVLTCVQKMVYDWTFLLWLNSLK